MAGQGWPGRGAASRWVQALLPGGARPVVQASAGDTAEGGRWAHGVQARGEVRVQQASGRRSGHHMASHGPTFHRMRPVPGSARICSVCDVLSVAWLPGQDQPAPSQLPVTGRHVLRTD